MFYCELCLKKKWCVKHPGNSFQENVDIELKIHCQKLEYFCCSPDTAEIQVESSWDISAFLDVPLGRGMTATP